MESDPKYKKMTTAAQQGTFIYLHGRRNEEGAWT
jgi:hypothetical protein